MPPSGDDAYRHAITAEAVTCPYCESTAASADLNPGWLAHLYVCLGLSTYQISERTGVERQRVNRALRRAGVPVRARGAGRLRPARRTGEPPDLPRLLRELYEQARLSSRQIAAILGMPERTVRDRLHGYGIKARSRGGWNREDRTTVPADVLELLYVQFGMTAAEVGLRLGVSGGTVLRSAHALGIPVRSGGAVPWGTGPLRGPEDIELVNALYADPLIAAALTAHDVPRVPAGGSLSQRFPVPVPLATPLVKDLYWGCGTGLNHIELLTGQPAESIRGFMRRAGIPLRNAGGRTPFLRRWRSSLAGSAAGLPGRLPRDGLYPRSFQEAGHAARAARFIKGDAR
jgi:DNA-binding CsgD family transcriptional regulator